jgi:hypothetical protein
VRREVERKDRPHRRRATEWDHDRVLLVAADMQPESYVTQNSTSQGDMEGAGCYIGGIHLPQGSHIVSVAVHETEA